MLSEIRSFKLKITYMNYLLSFLSFSLNEESDPKVGTGKKPKGSSRRLYTDENPKDTVSVKFRTKEDIVETINYLEEVSLRDY